MRPFVVVYRMIPQDIEAIESLRSEPRTDEQGDPI